MSPFSRFLRLPASFTAIATVSLVFGLTGSYMETRAERIDALLVTLAFSLAAAAITPFARRLEGLEGRRARYRMLVALRQYREARRADVR